LGIIKIVFLLSYQHWCYPSLQNVIPGRKDKLLNAFLLGALQHYGYPVLWLIVFVAAAGAPISGSLLLFAAGAFSTIGDLNIFILFPVALSAAVSGDNLGYFIGFRMGTVLLTWLERQKRFRWITPQSLERARAYFRKRAGLAVFLTRFLIVALGGPINLLAGLEQYPYPNFLFWDVSGQILSAAISLGLGYVFAASWEELAGFFGALSSFILASLTALILAGILIRKIRQRNALRKRAAAERQEMQPLLFEATPGIALLPAADDQYSIPGATRKIGSITKKALK
jgi:membrane protein DedA with SNARE-associated domain